MRPRRAFQLSSACTTMPSQGEPRSGSSSSVSSSPMSSRAAGFSARRVRVSPEAMAKVATVATPKISDNMISGSPDRGARNSIDGTIRTASPTAPPRPVGNGQEPVRGSVDEKAAAQKVATTQTRPRHFSPSGRCDNSRQPIKASGSNSKMAARPSSCIARSEKMAPGKPSRFLIGVCVAWLSEGSCTDQVARAMTPSSAQVISASPANSLRRRRTMSRK